MSHRPPKPETSPKRRSASDWAMRNMRWEALGRAESVAASLREQARAARLVAMSPADRARELHLRAVSAESEAARLRRDHDRNRQVVAPPTRHPAPSPEVIRDHLIDHAVSATHDRVASLRKMGALAERNGVAFDVDAAISSGLSVEAARQQVTDLMADASESLVVHNRTSAHTAEAVNHADGWSAALVKVAARKGITLEK